MEMNTKKESGADFAGDGIELRGSDLTGAREPESA
jgi:hypothetical protein